MLTPKFVKKALRTVAEDASPWKLHANAFLSWQLQLAKRVPRSPNDTLFCPPDMVVYVKYAKKEQPCVDTFAVSRTSPPPFPDPGPVKANASAEQQSKFAMFQSTFVGTS